MNLIEVVNHTRTHLAEEAVARLVSRTLEYEGVDGAELAVEVVGERRMRALNAVHRGRDEITDVLSFPLEDAGEASLRAALGTAQPEAAAAMRAPANSAPPAAARQLVAEGPPRLLGDVMVCARQALRQARADGLPPAFEFAVLLVHGTLHLLGYDHEVDAGQMALRQAQILEFVDWEDLLAAPR
jgi:probable rRNA maturation factor